MVVKASLISVALLAGIAAPALGQSEDTDIVVEGQRADALRTLRQVRALSRDVDGNLSRFEDPVCPGAAGLPPRLARGVVERMRAGVAEVGARLAAEGCTPNLTVIVTDDGPALIEGLRQKSPTLFGYQTATEIAALRDPEGPAWSWQTTEPKRADGMAVPKLGQIAPGQGAAGRRAYAVPNAKMSRLASTVRQDTGRAFVVLARASVEGKTLSQIADYALLHGLAGTRAGTAGALGNQSIAALFEPVAPSEWTAFDRAYLRGLYSGTNGLTYDQKTREIAQDVTRALER